MLHRLAWYQLISEKRRLMAALAGIAFAVLLQLMQFGFRDALFTSATLIHARLRGELVMASPQYEYVLATGGINRRRLAEALASPGVATVSPVYVGVVPFKNVADLGDHRIFVVAFNPDDAVLDDPTVMAHLDRVRIPDTVIFDELGRAEFGPVAESLNQGRDVIAEIGGRRMTIGGLFKLGVSFAANGHVIMSDSTYRRTFNRPDGVYDFGLVRLQPGTDIARAKADLQSRMPADVHVMTRDEFVMLEQTFWDKSQPIGFIFLMGTFIGLLVGAVIVYQILYTDVSDHLAEYATLKAMGYKDRAFYFVVLEESLILSVAGFPFGYGLALVLYALSRNATHLPIEMTFPRAALVFVLTIAMCAASGIVATRKLRAADPAEVF